MAKPTLMDVLDQASAEDLEEIDKTIETTRKRLDSLIAVRRVIDVKINGKRKRAAPSANGHAKNPLHGGGMVKKRREVLDYLAAAGPTKPSTVAEQCGVPLDRIEQVLDHEWFVKAPNGIGLSPAGRKEAA